MKFKQNQTPESITAGLIAPCGMNCAICSGYLREEKYCSGCNADEASKPKYCIMCRIRNCGEVGADGQWFCAVAACRRFPCQRLRQLDKRYRTRYGMSMIENLEQIAALGIEEFAARERARWTCPQCGSVICVHKTNCVYCGYPR